MVFLVGLGKLIKRIWKKKTYRWLSYAICIITFSTLILLTRSKLDFD